MYSIDVSEENFQTEVLDKSHTVPVVVDFWAEWCQPCQILKPVLEALAAEYNGKFILAKINADSNQALAAQFGVRGIPSVKAISGGNIVNEFSGVLPEAEIRQFLDQLIPNESELQRRDALKFLESGDIDSALQGLDKAIELDENNFNAQIDKAEICFSKGEMNIAEEMLKKIPLATAESNPRVHELLTSIEIANRTKDLPEKQTLIRNIEKNPKDLKSKLNLANVSIAEKNYPLALDLLFEIIQQDKNFGADVPRKTVLEIFTLIGPQDNLVREARKKLSRLLN
jgi:putative thioredoxin